MSSRKIEYKYYFTIDAVTTQCYPKFSDGTEIKWKKYEEEIFLRKELDGSVRFTNDDYNTIINQYLDKQIEFDIYSSCDDYTTPIYSGIFRKTDCHIDEDNCIIEASISIKDEYSCVINNYETEYNILDPGILDYAIYDTPAMSLLFDFNRRISDIIQFMLDEMGCGLTYKSDFFSNFAGSYIPNVKMLFPGTNPFYEPVLNCKSNMVYRVQYGWGGFDPATRKLLSLKKLMKWLRDIYNVRWYISGTTFRIEHIYWFTQTMSMYDFTVSENYPSHVKEAYHTSKYEYLNDLPDREEFRWQDEYNYVVPAWIADYSEYFIQYTENIKKPNVYKHDLSEVSVDILKIINYNEDSPIDGFFLGHVVYGPITYFNQYYLAWNWIVILLWPYNTPYDVGYHGYIYKDSSTWATWYGSAVPMKIKKQDKFSFYGCCDLFNITPHEYLMRTYLGEGEIYSMSYNLMSGKGNVELLYEAEECEPIGIPTPTFAPEPTYFPTPPDPTPRPTPTTEVPTPTPIPTPTRYEPW